MDRIEVLEQSPIRAPRIAVGCQWLMGGPVAEWAWLMTVHYTGADGATVGTFHGVIAVGESATRSTVFEACAEEVRRQTGAESLAVQMFVLDRLFLGGAR
ncbi:hypothetical protein [Streptomyces antimicrobicus]|uniref:Uncharacterized protein n=1 Tax=Streptomyces antimicrobicus TaxID=2883108 RepID=A0ABS8BB93_9ACTN|nr:hypothetical protein [Streptomyces antimicrobicus]MCB5181886.1 hypothetical protein [Streptomyces antimicrobicus]